MKIFANDKARRKLKIELFGGICGYCGRSKEEERMNYPPEHRLLSKND